MIGMMSVLLFASTAFNSLISHESKPIVLESLVSSPKVGDLIEIDTLAQVVGEIDDPRSLIFIDIDDTLIDFETHIGCKQWRSQIKKTSLKSYHDGLILYIAKQMTMVPVEQETAVVIKELQKKGYFLFPLTARERDCWYDLVGIPDIDELTHQALLNAQMDFTQTSRPDYFDQMNQDNFYRGIYFSKHPLGSEKTKGETIKDLLAPLLYSPVNLQEIKICFIDDKREQCESVLSAIKELGIQGKVFWYRACEKNHRDFDFTASLVQLESLLFDHKMLSNEEASKEIVAKGYPTAGQLIESILLQLHNSEDPALKTIVKYL
jgi:hypothetical protein